MVDPFTAKAWVKSHVGSTMLAQIGADPGLPQPKPTVSLWQQPPHPDVSNIQSSVLPQITDYLVIGSGVTGCGAVKALLDSPKSRSQTVTVIDARGLCSGATGRNGGQLIKPYARRYVDLLEHFGVETANKVARMALYTLERVHQLAASYDDQLKSEAIARRTTKFIVYTDANSWERAQKAVKVYEENIPEERGSYQPVSKEEIASKWNMKGVYGGYMIPAGVCWPYRLITGVFKRLLDQYPGRLNIETNTPVTTILYDDQANPKYPYIVTTPRGIIRAATIIHCTNGHAGHLLPLMRGKITPFRGTMSVQAPGSKFPNLTNEQSWSFLGDPEYDKRAGTIKLGWWYALQNPPHGDVWIGGDHKKLEEVFTADDSTVGQEGKEKLSGILSKTFNENLIPEPPKIRAIWTGVMTRTGDALPFVGNLPSCATGRPGKNEWIAAGWNSYGMTNGLTSGEAVARMILEGKAPEWFPEAYLPTEKRLNGNGMSAEAMTTSFLEWSGVGATVDIEMPKANL